MRYTERHTCVDMYTYTQVYNTYEYEYLYIHMWSRLPCAACFSSCQCLPCKSLGEWLLAELCDSLWGLRTLAACLHALGWFRKHVQRAGGSAPVCMTQYGGAFCCPELVFAASCGLHCCLSAQLVPFVAASLPVFVCLPVVRLLARGSL